MTLTHAVMFTLHDSADAPEAAGRLRALVGQIPSLLGIQVGTSADGTSPHVLLLTRHADEAGLGEYQEHPVHQELLAWIRPRIAGRAVVDTVDLA
jgi:Stress responsive A/B Barrel Domain